MKKVERVERRREVGGKEGRKRREEERVEGMKGGGAGEERKDVILLKIMHFPLEGILFYSQQYVYFLLVCSESDRRTVRSFGRRRRVIFLVQ